MPASWSCIQADAVEFLLAQADDSIDLLFTSPPYELARTYGIGEKMVGGQAWVDWMVSVVRAAAPKVKGLIAINCEGQTRNYAYSGAPFLLFADLHRAGFNMRKPPIFYRVGIPGSGGPDWLRNDYEPIICVTREGRLPWSDNTACGHPPKWAPGGEMSHRVSDGSKRNQWGGAENGNGSRRPNGERQVKKRPGHKINTRPRPGQHSQESTVYEPPALANPGNVLDIKVGGGLMGHLAAHDNEAPFPVDLPAFFVKSFCPPDGLVCDPFNGSGTTCHAAFENGRNFVGCDLRQSQVDLCHRRMKTVTPAMF